MGDMMKKIVLIAGGVQSKVIIDIIKSSTNYEIVGITDPNPKLDNVLGIPILGDDKVLYELYESEVKNAFICIGALGNSHFRNNIYTKLKDIGYNLPVLIHNSASVSPYATIGEGTCVMPGAVINAGANLGSNCIINTNSVVEHDCIIGDNVQISPSAALAGGVKIGNNSFIGIGSSVIQEIEIGSNVIVGAGAVVIDNVPDNVVAVGVPAKVIKQNYSKIQY